MSSNGYIHSEEWTRAQDAVARSLGFRVIRSDGAKEGKITHPDTYQLLNFDIDAKGKEVTRGVRPCEKATYDAFIEAVRYRIDHAGAAKLSWDLYMAATGETIDSFNGMPAGGPVEKVKDVRAKLLWNIQDMLPIHRAVLQVAESDGSYTTEIAGVVIAKAGREGGNAASAARVG